MSGASNPGRPVGVDTHVAEPAENNVCVSSRRSAIAENVSTETKNDNADANACRRLAAWYEPSCESCRALALLSADRDAAIAGNDTAHRIVAAVGNNTRHTRAD